MISSVVSALGRAFRGLWWLLDFSRRALLNLLLLLFVLLLLWGSLRGGPQPLQAKTALVLSLPGGITEQRAVASRTGVLRHLQGEDNEQIQLRDVLAVLDAAARDPQISQAVLVLDDFSGAGLSTLHEVASAIQRFKAAGKPVIAWGSHYDQRQYYLAAHASEVWLHPMGSVLLEGYGSYRAYYKDLLDKVGVTAHVIRAGKFKNYNESYTANGPSPETLQADGLLYNTLWTTWTTAVERARKLPLGSIAQAIESLPDSLVEGGGDAAQWAVQRKWVDALKTRDEMRAALIERGAADAENKSFRQVSMNNYLGRLKPEGAGDAVGVIVAEGSITEGRSGPGAIGGLSTSELVRQARDDPKIKAVVLRVNSPGGSAFASELIRHELELTRKAGKPVVVSMGDVAASGGYWIATASDEVLADAGTVTGSIGVIAMLPTAKAGMDKLGVNAAGVTTTWLGGGFDPRRDLEPRLEKLVQAGIDQTYRTFIAHVVAARKSTPEKIAEVAQGRVWTGQDAFSHGLVDRLGSLGDALKSAAGRARLEVGYRVQYIEAPPGRLQLWLQRLGVQFDVAGLVGRSGLQTLAESIGMPGAATVLGLVPPVAGQMADDMTWLADLAGRRLPYAAMVHCLCSAP